MIAILYSRFSPRPDAAESKSLDAQIAHCTALCTQKGWTITNNGEAFKDPALSGATMERPALEAAIKETIKHGPQGVLVFYNLSRLSRSMQDACAIASMINKAGGHLISCTEPIDTTTPQGVFVFHLFAAFAQFQRALMRQGIADARKIHAANGYCLGAQPPWGYTAKLNKAVGKRMLTENPDEVASLALMRAMRASGSNYRQIAERLTGLHVPRGKMWTASTVHQLLKRKGE